MTEPILTGHKGFTVRGPVVRTCNADESDPKLARIPGLWRRFMEAGGPQAVNGGLDAPVSVAVYTRYQSGHSEMYTTVVGTPLVISEGTTTLEHKTFPVPDGSYLLFEAQGEMPQALVSTWQRIWEYFEAGPPYQRAYDADFEIHDASEPDRVEVYIGVR